MKILTFSSLYPNAAQPTHGLFVEQRLRQLVAGGAVSAEVLAPVPWFPFKSSVFGQYAQYARVPRAETRGGIRILHPAYPSIPKVGMMLAPYLMARSMHGVLRKLIAQGRDFDLIDAHYFFPDGVAAVALGQWLSKPVVITARGSDINVIAQIRGPGEMIRKAAAAAAGVVAVSDALRGELIRIGVAGERICVLRNGVDLQRFRPLDRRQARATLKLTGTTLLAVGHLKPGKGHRLLIQALAQLPQVTLLVVGDGPLRGSLERLADSLGVAERLHFVGAVAHDELCPYYNAADMLVLPSAREGLPNVVLESLACGTPVVATAVGGIPEVLTTPAAGLMTRERSCAALVECIQRLLRDMPAVEATRAHAEQFSWQATTDGQLKLFKQILSAPQAG